MKIQDEAEWLAELGLSVIRIAAGQKVPIEMWSGFCERRRTPEEARRDFAAPSNLGIVCGPISGVVVVDCDSTEAERHIAAHLPNTPMMVCTPRGGRHRYFRYPVDIDVRCRARVKGMAMDIRAARGVSVVPPSRGIGTARYSWRHGPPTAEMLRNLPVFDPRWLATPQEPRQPVMPIAGDGELHSRGRAYIAKIVATSGEGGHNATYRATAVLRELFGFTAEEAYSELLSWNLTNALPPWSAEELRHKVESVFGRAPYQSHGRQISTSSSKEIYDGNSCH